MRFVAFLGIALVALGFAHKYYVSNTKMFYNEQTRSFEITMKIFTDDLERVLRAESSDTLRLALGTQPLSTNHAMEDYLRQHFLLMIDEQPVTWSYLGMEVEYDMTYMYMEFQRLEPLREIRVRNTTLFDYFEKQSNIINIDYKGANKKLILLKEFDTDSMFN